MFLFIQSIELVCTLILLSVLIVTLYKKGIVISPKWCAYYIFNIFFIVPNFIMILNMPLDIRAYGYQFIEEEWQIEVVYTIFMVFTNEILRKGALKSKQNSILSFSSIRNMNVKLPLPVIFVTLIGTLLPFFAALLSPQPNLYFASFAPFSRSNVYDISQSATEWHNSIMSWSTRIALVSVVLLWYKVQKTKKTSRIIGKVYLFIVAIEILLFSSKRTLGTLLLLIIMVIEIIFSQKKTINKIFFFGGIAVAYFILYQSIVQKTVGGGVSTAVEMYIIYFSRILDFRYVTYSIIHPEVVKILDYPCQSFIFDLFPYIRRAVWENKPYPFGVYYTAAWNNQAVTSVTYRYTVSWFSEAFANLSWIGIPIGVWLYNKMLNLFEKFQNPIVKVFSIYVAVYFMVTHVQSNFVSIGILVFLYFVFERRYRRKKVNLL